MSGSVQQQMRYGDFGEKKKLFWPLIQITWYPCPTAPCLQQIDTKKLQFYKKNNNLRNTTLTKILFCFSLHWVLIFHNNFYGFLLFIFLNFFFYWWLLFECPKRDSTCNKNYLVLSFFLFIHVFDQGNLSKNISCCDINTEVIKEITGQLQKQR